MKTPAEVYVPSHRKYDPGNIDLEYTGMLTRKVSTSGTIKIHNRQIPISTALKGWTVGLDPVATDHYEVHFANLLIGRIELSSESFLGGTRAPKERHTQRT